MNTQCRLSIDNILCLPHINCPNCVHSRRVKNAFALSHYIVSNIVKNDRQSVIIEVIIKNKTTQIIKNITLRENLIIYNTKFVLKNVNVIQTAKHIKCVSNYSDYPENMLQNGDIINPCKSYLCPSEEVRIIYELLGTLPTCNYVGVSSCIDLFGDLVEHEYSKIVLCLPKDNDLCCQSVIPMVCGELIINCQTEFAPTMSFYTHDFCEDGQITLTNIRKKCSKCNTKCNNICNNSCYTDTNINTNANTGCEIISFDYSILNNYEIISAEAITGDYCVIPILEFVTNTYNPRILGKFTTPIGRNIATQNSSCPYSIQYLKFTFANTII
jgi:hypothetical protein